MRAAGQDGEARQDAAGRAEQPAHSRPALEQGSASGMDGAAYTADAAEAAAHIVGLEAAEFEGVRA